MSLELSEWVCGLSLKTGCMFVASVYIIHGIVFLTAEILTPLYVDVDSRINLACRYLNLFNNALAIVMGFTIIVGAILEDKITLLVCLILWVIHFLSRIVVSLLITMYLNFFLGIHVVAGFVATFLIFCYFGLIIYSFYMKL